MTIKLDFTPQDLVVALSKKPEGEFKMHDYSKNY